MRANNSVFRDLLKLIPMAAFDRLVEVHGADKHVRRLRTKDQLIALLYGQFSGAGSLREIEAGLSSHAARLYHLGGRSVSRSTLSDANRQRDARVFLGLFEALLPLAAPAQRTEMGEVLRLIDSTTLPFAGSGADWAQVSATTSGAKLHLVLDPDAGLPVYFEVTPAKVNDITAAKAMPIEAGATYVFDLGYYDYGWWAALGEADCRIVTRFKKNTPLEVIEEPPLPKGAIALSDRIGFLPRRMAKSRANPMADAVREITVRTDTGKILRLFTNDLDSPADDIAALYKRRWQIELFFRWIKQTLKIKAFLGRSLNAVKIHIAAALIACLLIHIARRTAKARMGLQGYARLIRANLMHRKQFTHLEKEAPFQCHECQQITMAFL